MKEWLQSHERVDFKDPRGGDLAAIANHVRKRARKAKHG